MAEYDIQAKVTYDTTQAQASLKGVAQAAGDTATATTKVGDASAKAQVNVGQFGSSLGLAGQAVGKLSPQMGGLVTMVGSATGAMQSLMTAGLGPVGLAIGAVSVALSAATALWDSQQAAIKRNEDALREYDKIQSEIAANQRERARDREMEQLDEEYRNSEAGRRARNQANWERGYERNRQADLQRMALLAEELDAEEQRRQERRQRRAAAGGTRRPTLEQLMQQAGAGGALSLEGLNMETLGREPEAMAIAQTDKGADIEQQRYLEQLDRNRAYLEEREAQEKEAAERLVAINDTVFQALESAFSSSVNAWLDGSMSMGEAALEMVKNVAKSLASEAIIQGLKQTALGLSALAVGSPTAAGHFAAAGKWAAVGVAAGIVGAASGAFGGGGGGGGAPAAATGGPALTAGAREGAGTTVVINWGSSGLVYAADRAQLGRDISGMISEAHGRLGRGM